MHLLHDGKSDRLLGQAYVYAAPRGPRHGIGKLHASKAVNAGRAGGAPVKQRRAESRHARGMRVHRRILRRTVLAVAGQHLQFSGEAASGEPPARDAAETPVRIIRGPDTQLGGGSLSVDPLNNLLVASGRDDSIVIFDRMASGNTKPLRVIRGPKTQIDRINQMQVYPEGKLVIVAMPGIQGEVEPPRVFVGMWSLDDDGDVAPKWTINGNQTGLYKPFAVALNPEHKELYVTDMRLNGVFTFSAPEVFVPAR